MNHSNDKPIACDGEDLWALAEAVCEGTATHEQCDRLSERIATDEDAAMFYATYLRMHGRMQWNCRHGSTLDTADGLQLAGDAAVPSVSRSPLPRFLSSIGYPASGASLFVGSTSFAYLVAAVLVGLGLLTASLIPADHSVWIATKPAESSGSSVAVRAVPTVEYVGRITRTFDCQWTHGVERQERHGDSNVAHAIPLGERLIVKSGLLEIIYDSGAKVVLQGPATYRVDASDGGYLAFGKLTAQLEERPEVRSQRSEVRGQKSEAANQKSEIRNHQFAVRTPTAVVTDLGTEFGVEVDGLGCTTSHVFRGSVRVETAVVGENRQSTARVLRANESAEVKKTSGEGPTAIQTVSLDPTRFVRPEEFEKVSDQDRQAAFRRWDVHSRELRRDPSLVAYYDFQRKEGTPSVLPNVATATGGRSLDGVIQNARWTNGRMPGKHALRFQTRADRVELALSQTIDDLTLAAWVCIDVLTGPSESEAGYSALLMSNGWGDRAGMVHWQVRSNGSLGFTACNGCNVYESSPSFTSSQLGRWMHVAFVYDHAAKCAVHYVNGKLTESGPIPSHKPICIGPACIGQWNGWDFGRNLQGRIDELAVFGRALKHEEIRKMFEAGRVSDRPNGKSESAAKKGG